MSRVKNIEPQVIVKAIECSENTWRSIRKVSKDLNISTDQVNKQIAVLTKNENIVIGRSKNNNELIFTTKAKYSKEKFLNKVLDISRGEIIR